MLAGDFNLYHPQWDYFDRYEQKAETLLQLALQWDLSLRTPRGTITREPQGGQRGRPSTIDHFWASDSLQATYYGLGERGRSDYYPQVLELRCLQAQGQAQTQSQPEGWNWKMVNKKRVEAEAALLPGLAGGLQSLRARLTTVESLEKEFDWLVGELQRIAAAGAP